MRIKSLHCAGYIIYVSLLFLQCSNPIDNSKPNILLICIDDLRPELNSFGATYIHSPHIDELAKNGVSFLKHYVNAPSCGPSRYTLLTGRYGPATNDALFQRAKKLKQETETVHPSMPEWFKSKGYTTVSVGKVSHHPGGRGGDDWDDDHIIEMPNAWDKHLMPSDEWLHPRGAMHGLAHGEIRVKAADMDVFQSSEGDDNIYPDGKIINTAIEELNILSSEDDKPFFMAVGIIRPHLPFGSPRSYFQHYDEIELPPVNHPQKPTGKTTWHKSGEFMKYNRWGNDMYNDIEFSNEVRRHYAACVSYADAQVGKLMNALKQSDKYKNTIVLLWGDHGWHLGEHAIWGKHSLFEESLHSPLIINYPGSIDADLKSSSIVETLDIFPTLCQLAGIETPAFAQGKSLMASLENPNLVEQEAIAYIRNAKTIRTQNHRLIVHDSGEIELYDHTSEEGETKNISKQHPKLVESLQDRLKITFE